MSGLSHTAAREAGRRRRGRRAAFTLIEVLMVITVIAILMGIVMGGARYAASKAEDSRARAILAKLELAMEEYKVEFDTYPQFRNVTITNYPNTAVTRESLFADNSAATGLVYWLNVMPMRTRGRSFVDPTIISDVGGTNYILDAWGAPFIYHSQSRESYQLLSIGRDERDPADDIRNWH
jgi:prepilin-type N-terminal cleavage/methylation domain-containing protein